MPESAVIFNEINTTDYKISRRKDGIVQVIIQDYVDIDIEQSQHIFNTVKSFSKKPKDLFVLVIAGKYSTATKEAREFSSTEESSSITFAEAIVIHSLAQKLIINFMLKFYKPKRHLKMFTNQGDAVEWLHSMKTKME